MLMKKDFLNLRRSRWLLLSLFALFVGVSPTWADVVTEGFSSSSTLPEGWELKGQDALGTPYSLTSDYNKSGSSGDYCLGTSSTSTSEVYVITPKVTGTVTIPYRKWASGSGTSNIYVYEYTDEGSVITATSLGRTYSTAVDWANITIELGSKETRLAIIMKKAVIDDFTADYVLNIEGPAFRIANFTDGDSFGYGMVNPGTTKEFTLKNPGTKSVTVNITTTGGFTSDISSVTIDAKGQQLVTVTVPDETANGTVVFTPTTVGLDAITINLSCVIKDPNKVYLDFSDGAIPDGWTSVAIGSYASSYGTPWAASTGYVGQSGTSSSYEWAFTSPKMVFSENETIIFETQKYTSSTWYNPSITVQYKTEDGDWTTVGSTLTDDTYDNWTKRSVTIPTADAKYIRFTGWYVKLRNIYGGELPLEPKMVVTQPASLDFGLLDKDASPATKTFTIANTGLATLNGICVSSANAAFTITDAPSSLAAGASQEVTITMATGATGALSSLITVSATGMEDATFTVSGVVLSEGAFVVDFNDNKLPEGWTNEATNKWSFGDGKAYTTAQSSKPAELVTKKLTFADNDFFVISATSYDNYDNNYIEILGSTDDGTTWTAFDAKKFVSRSQIPYGSYATVVVSGIPSNVNKIKIRGYYVRIDEIAGLTYDANAPVLTVDPTTAADFGKVKAQPAAKTYTITNSGTGTLEGTITSSVPGHFTVSQPTFSLGAGENMTFEVNLVFDENYGEKTATITVHPTNDGLDDVVINATATTADPNIWEEDFEGGSVPEGWIANGWTVTNSNYSNNGTFMFAAGSSNTKAYSPRLYAEKDQVLSFYVGGADATDFQTVKWSHDRNAAAGDWTLIGEFTSAGTQEFTAPETGYYYLSFQGKYTSVDNFYGFKEAPLEHDAYITAQNIPATGTQYVEYTATVTVKEMAGKAENLTAKFFIGGVQYGADVDETVDANGTKTFTVTFTPDAAVSGNAHFTVTNGDINLTSDNVDVVINAAFVLNENINNTTNLTVEETKPAVVVNYSKAAGKWGTIALPFQTTTEELSLLYGTTVKAFTFADNDGGNLTFNTATTLLAGYPYVIYSDGAMSDEVKFFNKAVTTTAHYDEYGGVTFQAIYDRKTYDGDSWYGITPAGEIRPAGEGASVKALRGYLQATAGARLSIFIEDLATGITTVLSPKEFEAEGAYNLQGQKVQQTKKGLYIVNGRKVVVR